MRKLKLVPECDNCGARDICGTAITMWDEEESEWVIHSNDDEGWCSACMGDVDINYVEVLGERY